MKRLEPGKFYLTRERHILWKTDEKAANALRNKVMTTLPPGTLVLFTKFGKYRYLQVVFEEMVGYIWCNANVSVHDHLVLVTEESLEEMQKAMQAGTGWRKHRHVRS